MKYWLLSAICISYISAGLAQNVGIGTNTPTDPLHVKGNVRFEKLAANPQAPVYVDSMGRLFTNQDYTNVNNYAIPDNSCTGVTSVILVSGLSNSVSSSNIEVKITIQHSYDADLRIYLISPTLQVLNLARNIGGSGDNFSGTIFTDNAPASIATGTAPFTGRFQPLDDNTTSCAGTSPTVSTFSQFGGGNINPNGQWILKVYDSANLDVGSLVDWTISFNGNINGATRTAFSAYNSASYPVTSGLDVPALFNSKAYDLDNSFNTATGTFTPRTSGVYHFTGTIFWNTGSPTDLTVDMKVNGIMRKRFYSQALSGSYYQQRLDTDMYLDAGNAVNIVLNQNSGFSFLIVGSDIFTNWSGFKVN